MLIPTWEPLRERADVNSALTGGSLPCAHRQLVAAILMTVVVNCLGCSVIGETREVAYLARRTTQFEPRLFRFFGNARATKKRNRTIANEVWYEVSGGCPDDFSEHYSRGFIDGFADYMYRGGEGEAPLLPPRDYWNLGYESPAGRQHIQEWYEGFRHGASECMARGYRELVVVPSSSRVMPGEMIGSEMILEPELVEPEFLEPGLLAPDRTETEAESGESVDLDRNMVPPETTFDRDRLVIPNDGADVVPRLPIEAPEDSADPPPSLLDE